MHKVLIVDDEPSIISMLRDFLDWNSYGFVVEDEAHDGTAALKKLAAEHFDLVITDIRMPGMDGIEFLKEIKNMNLDCCFMIMSTYTDFEYAQQGIRLGVFDYIIKPIDSEVLGEVLKRVKKHLDEKELQKSRLEDHLNFYCLKNQEKKLTNLILAGNYDVLDEAVRICLELDKLTDHDLYKTSLLAEGLLQNLSEEIDRHFPWLANLKKPAFDDALNNAKSLSDLKLRFLSCISIMLNTIVKFELHHSNSLVKKACCYVMNHVEENITLDNLEKEIHISKNYIGKLFKQKTGCNFVDYVTKVKMEHAKYLLGTGDYKNYEISEKLGYSTPDYFCRLFKEYTGHTPLEFRKMGT
ncbi:Hypothetical protein LUCI_5067 [Lucifera butyrica]|uniref:Transcription regulator hth arac- type n=1 Tax=Lucifera butyrica TaxID=1351585 RepID=A0A498REL9_9FIRM|nr:response regulator [Lucifera butyrica]VBB09769.1 Hypothetical protein LUCI_5067 [Lucifera butyrica]